MKKGEGNTMKKDIEWLKAEVWKQDIVMDKGYIYTDDLMSIINEVDEPEVLSQDWIDNNSTYDSSGGVIDEFVYVDDLENLIIPKQELSVIPKYVADWITKHRDSFDLYPALDTLEDNSLTWERIYKWYRMNTHKFVNAYLTGEYEVEEESLHYALVKGHGLIYSGNTYWTYDKYNDDVFIGNLHSSYDNFLTEMSKEDWNKLGINESNADFVEVDEMA